MLFIASLILLLVSALFVSFYFLPHIREILSSPYLVALLSDPLLALAVSCASLVVSVYALATGRNAHFVVGSKKSFLGLAVLAGGIIVLVAYRMARVLWY